MLLDCGSGALHAMGRERLWWKTLSHIVISHFHTDHVGDLATILFALRHGVRPPRSDPLLMLGLRGMEAHLDGLAQAHGDWVRDPGFPVEGVELDGGGLWPDPAGRFTLRTHATPQTDASLAFRVETAAGALGYTWDTGLSDELGSFFCGCRR